MSRSERQRRKGLSGLTGAKRQKALQLTIQAAKLGLRRKDSLHYTQGPNRWEGIDGNEKAWKGECPNYADCSSFATWCLWNGLDHYRLPDTVNGAKWKAGYTGTLNEHGRRVRGLRRRGDLILYGDPYGRTGHVAIYVGAGMVISFGSEPGPFLIPVHYRRDYHSTRRYI